jgi:hypothetical protein
VRDFWLFALGDLRMHNARGYLAEFIVAKAIGIEEVSRVEWDAYDILWNGITIEVKSSAYLQSWDQRRLSDIRFSGLKGTRFQSRHDLDPAGKRYNAMVYAFCEQSARSHVGYDQLDMRQWQFFVAPRKKLTALGYASIGLASVRRLSGDAVRLDYLAEAITKADRSEPRRRTLVGRMSRSSIPSNAGLDTEGTSTTTPARHSSHFMFVFGSLSSRCLLESQPLLL